MHQLCVENMEDKYSLIKSRQHTIHTHANVNHFENVLKKKLSCAVRRNQYMSLTCVNKL